MSANEYDHESLMADVLRLSGVRVCDLHPGDLVNHGTHSATFITATAHPIWPHLQLVVWRTDPSLGLPGNWSHDALDSGQVVGTVVPAAPGDRADRLREALLGVAS